MTPLRRCRPEDFATLWAIDQQCFPPEIAYSKQELLHYLRATGAICLVAESPGSSIAGFALGQTNARGIGHIITLDVHPDHRQAGLGWRLMEALEEDFRKAGCSSSMLEVAVNNLGALAFYKKHGYSVLKTLRRYYPGNLDGLLMGKRL